MGDEYFLYNHVPVIFWWLRWGNLQYARRHVLWWEDVNFGISIFVIIVFIGQVLNFIELSITVCD